MKSRRSGGRGTADRSMDPGRAAGWMVGLWMVALWMAALWIAGRWRRAVAAIAGTGVFWLAPWALAADTAPDGTRHVGTWRCMLSGNPALGDQRMLLRFEPDSATAIARIFEGGSPGAWVPASNWRESGGRLSFADPRTGRDFEGGMRGSALGGTWQARALVGVWWCSVASAEEQTAVAAADVPAPAAREWLPPLLQEVVATPAYPRAAIREAREGRAVVCFLVDAQGMVLEPEVIELSDEIFRAPSLESLARSRYRGWDDETLLRPGCRSFLYRLDPVY